MSGSKLEAKINEMRKYANGLRTTETNRLNTLYEFLGKNKSLANKMDTKTLKADIMDDFADELEKFLQDSDGLPPTKKQTQQILDNVIAEYHNRGSMNAKLTVNDTKNAFYDGNPSRASALIREIVALAPEESHAPEAARGPNQ